MRSQYEVVRSCPPEIIIPSSADTSSKGTGSGTGPTVVTTSNKVKKKKQRKTLKRYMGEEFELNALE